MFSKMVEGGSLKPFFFLFFFGGGGGRLLTMTEWYKGVEFTGCSVKIASTPHPVSSRSLEMRAKHVANRFCFALTM